MSFATYADLQTSIINFSHRSDLTAMIPDFIRLAEDKVYATLDSNEQDAKTVLATVANLETLTQPTDLIDVRSLSITNNGTTGKLSYLAPDQLASQYSDSTTGVPRVYTLIGRSFYFRPIPSAVYSVNLVYVSRLATLSNSNTTNWLLANYPLIYLYASLEQFNMYIKDLESASANEQEWQRVAKGINSLDARESASMTVKTDVNLSRLPR